MWLAQLLMSCMVSSSAESSPTLTWERSAFKLPVGSTLINSLQMMIIDRSTPNISDTNSPYPDTVHTYHPSIPKSFRSLQCFLGPCAGLCFLISPNIIMFGIIYMTNMAQLTQRLSMIILDMDSIPNLWSRSVADIWCCCHCRYIPSNIQEVRIVLTHTYIPTHTGIQLCSSYLHS